MHVCMYFKIETTRQATRPKQLGAVECMCMYVKFRHFARHAEHYVNVRKMRVNTVESIVYVCMYVCKQILVAGRASLGATLGL
jgi:hypothetical protein